MASSPSRLSISWRAVVVLVIAVVRLEAANDKEEGKKKWGANDKGADWNKNAVAPPEKFDWDKFYQEKETSKEANSAAGKTDWDLFFQSLKNNSKDAKDASKRFEWDKLIEALNNGSAEEDWNSNGSFEDLYKDLLLPEDGEFDDESAQTCSRGYSAYRGSCYKVSDVAATFTKCQEICEAEGGSLATINDDRLDSFLWNLIRFSEGTAQYGTWIGLYIDTSSQGYDWEWVDGSVLRFENGRQKYANPNGGAPEVLEGNLGCAKTSCATMIPTCYWCEDDPTLPRLRAWDQIRCIREQHCLCEEGIIPSTSYLKSVGNLDWPEFLTSAQPIYFGLGYPCLILLIWAFFGTLLVTRRPSDHPRQGKYKNVTAGKEEGFLYGNLLDSRSGELVDEWVVRGGYAAILYGLILFALAFTVSAQNSGMTVGLIKNALESFAMTVCKFAVGLSAFFVHRYLSPTSRAMAGPWVLILAVSKMAMAFGQFLMALGYLRVALTYETCEALSLFTWSCMIGVIFQSVSGFALFRVYYRTVRRVGDREVFSRVVGCWWSALVVSTFGVGIGFWWCGALMLIDADSGLAEMPFRLAVTACCQLTAGLSMLRANMHIRDFFNCSEGKAKYAELVERIGADSRQNGELRTRVARSMEDFEG